MFNLAPPTLWNIITVILWSTFSLLTSQLMVRNLFSPLVYLQIVLQYCLFWGTSSPFTFCVQNEEQEVTQSHRPLTTKVLGISGIRCVYIVNFFCILFHVYICFLSLFMHMFRCRGGNHPCLHQASLIFPWLPQLYTAVRAWAEQFSVTSTDQTSS